MKNILVILLVSQFSYLVSQENTLEVFNDYLIKSLSDKDKRGIKFALDNGASVHAVDKETGNTALILAAAIGNAMLVNYFIEGGANINAQNKFRQTALMHAVKNGFLKVVKILVDLPHCNVKLKNIHNKSALDIAYELQNRTTNKDKRLYAEITKEILRYQAKL